MSQCLSHAILRAASLLAPAGRRAGWLREWHSELWYVRGRAAVFCLGAFPDALWVRRNNPGPRQRAASRLESPASCLAFLATLAALSVLAAACLLEPLSARTTYWHLRVRDLPAGCAVMLLYTSLLLPVTRLVMGPSRAVDGPAPWPGRLRRGLFLAAKVALLQPVMLCEFFVLILAGPVLPLAPTLAIFAVWLLTFRWLILDQRRRCPVCLRLLANPVRIGTPSHSFLDWYGAESMCVRGHGLLQVPESSASYSGGRRWLRLDGSWSCLFPRAAGARQ